MQCLHDCCLQIRDSPRAVAIHCVLTKTLQEKFKAFTSSESDCGSLVFLRLISLTRKRCLILKPDIVKRVLLIVNHTAKLLAHGRSFPHVGKRNILFSLYHVMVEIPGLFQAHDFDKCIDICGLQAESRTALIMIIFMTSVVHVAIVYYHFNACY